MQIVSRSQWGARSPRSRRMVDWDQRTEVIFHHSTGQNDVVGEDDSIVRSIQRYHMDVKGWDDIGYNWLIGVGGDDDGDI